jgi:predicted transcriptional regulator of viral defense system
MSTFLKILQVREELLRLNIRIFSTTEFSRIFRAPQYSIKYFLEEQTNRGLFVRLKKGLYALKTDFPGEEEIANALYKPSYISFEYALAYYGILPEMPYRITCATTKPTRLFTIGQSSFAYYTIKEKAYQGYSLIKTEAKTFLMADKEKALVDYLYFESIGEKTHNDRLNFKNLDKNKLLDYAKLFNRKNLTKIVMNIYANI